MHTDKKGIRLLVAICKAKGLTDIVISPGSRNAVLFLKDAYLSPHIQEVSFQSASELSGRIFSSIRL